ncbi:hypothetical protein ACFLYF_02940 [Chloroflexota bacterium]
MRQWIVAVVLAVVVGGGVFGMMEIVDTVDRLEDLELAHAKLQSDYNSHQSRYNTLEADYRSLGSNYDSLQGETSELRRSYERLEIERENMRKLLEQYEKVPGGYYSTGAFPPRPNTYHELLQFLSSGFRMPKNYQANVFDCTESSAYLEWALESAGFDARIAFGLTPWDPVAGNHAWVMVFTPEYKVAIEATALTGEYNVLQPTGIVYPDDTLIPGADRYYDGYDQLFENVFQAIGKFGSTREWNWWEGYWGFR